MKARILFVALLFVLVSCAPRAELPATTTYNASKEAVYAAVVEAITTAPPRENSTGWTINSNDADRGFISVATTIRQARLIGGVGDVGHTLNATVLAEGNRSTVTLQYTDRLDDLANRIRAILAQRFPS